MLNSHVCSKLLISVLLAAGLCGALGAQAQNWPQPPSPEKVAEMDRRFYQHFSSLTDNEKLRFAEHLIEEAGQFRELEPQEQFEIIRSRIEHDMPPPPAPPHILRYLMDFLRQH